MTITPKQIREARALLGWNQAELADFALLSPTAVRDVEAERTLPRASTLAKIKEGLEYWGIEFTNGKAPGVRLRPPSKNG